MSKSFDTLTDELFATCDDPDEGVGDSFFYAISGASPRKLTGTVDYQDKTDSFAGSQITDQDMTVEVLKSLVPLPSYADRITLPKFASVMAPRDWKSDRSGFYWVIYLKKAR